MAEIRDDEGILGNNFAMAHKLMVRPCEGAVYLPDLAGTGKGKRTHGRAPAVHHPLSH